jgi:hypothetical protein
LAWVSRPRCRSIIVAERMRAVGLALFVPMMSCESAGYTARSPLEAHLSDVSASRLEEGVLSSKVASGDDTRSSDKGGSDVTTDSAVQLWVSLRLIA